MFLAISPEWRYGVDLVRKLLPEANEQQPYEDGEITRLPVVMVGCVAVLFEPVQQRAKFCVLGTEKEIYWELIQVGMDRVSGEEATRIEQMIMK